ncbi:MAG: hypothetical protein FIA99_15250 [Ruminiclostridium sp.]|nr:hypothetical protein [Ruminiclostridium sp.]
MKHGEEDLAKKLGLKDKMQLAIYETVREAMTRDRVAEEVKYYAGYSKEETIRTITLNIEEIILKTRVKGFRHNPTRISEMETAVYGTLLSKHYDDLGYDAITQLTVPLIDLTKIHYEDMEQ